MIERSRHAPIYFCVPSVSMHAAETESVARATQLRFFNKIHVQHLKFQKNLNVANDVLSHCAKSQDEIRYIRGYTKMTNSENVGGFKICIVHVLRSMDL
jgi:hypothetical protein